MNLRTKYRNQRHGGYASKREAELAANLHALERFGQITDLKEQVPYVLVPAQQGRLRNERSVVYIADFTYLDKDVKRHVVDSKGFKTKDYIIKRKLMAYLLEIEIEEL